jgi:hypothetical protein
MKEREVAVTPSSNEWLRRHLTERERALCRSRSGYCVAIKSGVALRGAGRLGTQTNWPTR